MKRIIRWKLYLLIAYTAIRYLRELARILGNHVTSFPAVTLGPLHYWHLERNKIRDLKYHEGDFKGKISLSSKTVSEILVDW